MLEGNVLVNTLRVGLARGDNPNLVEGQFGKMPGTIKEHNMLMQSIFTR